MVNFQCSSLAFIHICMIAAILDVLGWYNNKYTPKTHNQKWEERRREWERENKKIRSRKNGENSADGIIFRVLSIENEKHTQFKITKVTGYSVQAQASAWECGCLCVKTNRFLSDCVYLFFFFLSLLCPGCCYIIVA